MAIRVISPPERHIQTIDFLGGIYKDILCLLRHPNNVPSYPRLATMWDSDDDSEESLRETALCSSEAADVVIVVGGKEFHEYRQSLRCWSGFFDAAFRSGMKESNTQRFEFYDKDPKEWELVASLVSPMSADRVTMANVYKLLPWFDHLECKRGLEECDSLLHTQAERSVTKLGLI